MLLGLKNTAIIAVLGLLIGIVIGSVIAVIKVAPKYKLINRILDKICTVYVAIFRGTPIVVQLLLAYYVILPALGVSGVESLDVGIAVFVLLTAYDTQKIKNLMAERDEVNESSLKLALYGSFMLYLDFINLFLKLLKAFGKRK